VNPPGRPPEAPPPRGGPRAQGPLTPLTWRSDHVILRGGSPEDPPRRGHRPASPRALHVTHLALGARDPPGRPSPEDPPQAWPPAGPPGPFTPLTWRWDQVALPGGASPAAPPTSKAQGLLTPLTWRSEHVTLRGPRSPRRGQRPTPPRGSFTSLTWRSDGVGLGWAPVPGGPPEAKAGSPPSPGARTT